MTLTDKQRKFFDGAAKGLYLQTLKYYSVKQPDWEDLPQSRRDHFINLYIDRTPGIFTFGVEVVV